MSRIAPEIVDEIRNKADIVEIIKDYIPLNQKGKNFFGVCPFHQDHSPSMSVSREKQMFKCFSCGAAGNVFKFVSDFENISFVEAIQKVANKVGVVLELKDDHKAVSKYDDKYKIMDLANNFYQNNLNTKAGEGAKDYLKKRGLTEEMIKTFEIGLSFSNNQLRNFLNSKKIANEELFDLGLVNFNNTDYFDVFVDRILFPIHDAVGHVVAFTGRVYDSQKTPKYLNSKETVIFKKGNVLFNYHRAKDSVRLEKKLILVEGNMDALRMYASGFKNTVALMGTSLTDEQITLIQKLHVPVILMLDNDNAGALATETNGKLLTKANIIVEVVRLSNQKDPDEYILANGASKMAEVIKHPVSFLEFEYENLKENRNLQDPMELSNYVKDVLNCLETADKITIDIILNKLANEFNLSLEVLKQELKSDKQEIKIAKKISPKVKNSKYDISVNYILYYMMNEKKYIDLYQNNLGYFKEEKYRKIANEISYYAEEKNSINLADFLTYAETSPLKDEIYNVIKSINDPRIEDNSIKDYFNNIKEKNWEDELQKLKLEQKQVSDINEKTNIGQKIVEIMIKIQEIKKEKSVR